MEGKALYVTAWLTRMVLIQIYDGYSHHKFAYICFKRVEHKVPCLFYKYVLQYKEVLI